MMTQTHARIMSGVPLYLELRGWLHKSPLPQLTTALYRIPFSKCVVHPAVDGTIKIDVPEFHVPEGMTVREIAMVERTAAGFSHLAKLDMRCGDQKLTVGSFFHIRDLTIRV